MTHVVRHVLTSAPGKLTERGPAFPQKPADEILEAELLALREIRYALVLQEGGAIKLSDIQERAAPLASGHGVALRADIEQDLLPATVNQINKLIFMLIDSRRDSRDLSATFAEVAVARVSSLLPSFGALQAAVKRLIDEPRAEFKAKMEISDILAAVREEQSLRVEALEWIESIPKLITRWQADLDAR